MNPRNSPSRHFLSHTVEHVFGAVFVFAVAVAVGCVASAQNTSTVATPQTTETTTTSVTTTTSGTSGALTTDSTRTDSTSTTAPTPTPAPIQAITTDPTLATTTTTTNTTLSPTPSPVIEKTIQFGVTSAPITDCVSGRPMTEVFFIVSDVAGGRFQVSSDNGMDNAPLEWGRHVFPNGKYSWKGIPSTGYVVSGLDSGSFTLFGECLAPVSTPTATSTTTTFTSTTENTHTTQTSQAQTTTVPAPTLTGTTAPPPVARPQLKLFVDNMPVGTVNLSFDTEGVELRVVTPGAKKVNFYAMASNATVPILLGTGVIDDLLSLHDSDAWTYIWNTETARAAGYKVFARVLQLDGTLIETIPIVVTVDHTAELLPVDNSDEGAVVVASENEVVAPLEDRAQILLRVTSPESCTNERECAIYCMSRADEREQCTLFAQTVARESEGEVPSLADNIPEERITNMLTSPTKRPKDLPLIVLDATDFLAYCADPSHADVCVNALMKNDLATSESLAVLKAELIAWRADEQKLLADRIGARSFIDTDGDKITDYDEINIYHTDSALADTDGDGAPDGAEIIAHTNPNGNSALMFAAHATSTQAAQSFPAASEEVRIENPLIAGVTRDDVLRVERVVMTETPIDASGTSSKKLTFSGTSLPNSFLTIFVYSDPIVVTVRTDASGAWTYTLDKSLADGSHHVVTAITDAGGKILAKSTPLPFVKVAAAVSFGAEAFAPTQEPLGFFSGPSLYAFIAILIGVLGASFSVIGFIAYRRPTNEGTPPLA